MSSLPIKQLYIRSTFASKSRVVVESPPQEPGAIEFVVGIRAAGFVPVAFIDADHFAGVAGDAAVGEEVGRVGEDEVDGGFGDLGEEFEAVAVVEAEVVFGVVESGGRERIGGEFGHGFDDRAQSTD